MTMPHALSTPPFTRSSARRSAAILGLLMLAACQTPKPHRAPVEERAAPTTEPVAQPATDNKATAPAEPARPGTYTVKKGDTLIRIAFDQGLAWKDLAKWNGLEDNPNLIEVGQVLRVVAPGAGEGPLSKPVTSARVETKPLDGKPAPSAAGAPTTVQPSNIPASSPPPSVMPVASAPQGDGEMQWSWPAAGSLVANFDEQRSKGLAIGGKAGDPVLAAADGRVMYAGSGLRGYGNMVIIKHNDTYLSAYAHNQTLLVKEDQVVRKGQRIAEMGSTDADQVKLHFEIRRKGKPIDPAKLLPPR